MNRTLLDYLDKFVDEQQKNWDRLLPLALLAYRSSIHESTGFSPAFLNFSREIRLPVDIVVGATPEQEISALQFVSEMHNTLETVHSLARDNLTLSADSMKS